MSARLLLGSAFRGERGIVLPVVLVMLLLMTVTVLFLMRRGAVDELLASNVRQVTTLDTAAQFALRSCERLLWVSPPGRVPPAGAPNPPPVVTAPANSASAAWRDDANWNNTNSLALPAGDLGVDDARCLYEDASSELELNTETNPSPTGAGQLVPDSSWRKYRITAEVRNGNGIVGRAQAEVRMNVL